MINLNLNNKNALVCGSSQGIGLAAAIELADLGANVCLLSRNEESLKIALNKLPNNGTQNHSFLIADFNHPHILEEVVLNYLTDHEPFHILINNSGGPPGGQLAAAKLEEFDIAFKRHLEANHVLMTSLVPGMRSYGYGRIINVISTSVKQPLHGLGVSNTIRGAVANWAKTLAGELGGFGITVNNVLPGATNTVRLKSIIESKAGKANISIEQVTKNMQSAVPAGRFGEANEIGSAIAFLASPGASYINGINLPVDGGRTGCL